MFSIGDKFIHTIHGTDHSYEETYTVTKVDNQRVFVEIPHNKASSNKYRFYFSLKEAVDIKEGTDNDWIYKSVVNLPEELFTL